MKTKILLITLIGISFGLKAQNVDLNNSTDYIRIQKNGESGFSRAFGLNSSNHMYIGSVEKTIGKIFFFNKGTNHLMTINPNGNVGIGTTNPKATLDVNGNIKIKGGNQDFSISDIDDTDPVFGQHINYGGIAINGNSGTNRQMFMFTDGQSNHNIFTITTSEDSGNNWDTKFVLKQNGNIGIGTTNIGSWKLAVNGNIRAKEIKVETGWSDFVFYDNYKLPTLQEVENHIKEKGHLKDIPSAKDVEENGIYLGEMDSKLLQKIEELTLYTIQQEKKINEQANEIKELKSLNKKLVDLQKRLEKLEKK